MSIGIDTLIGKTISEISGLNPGSEEVYITCTDGKRYKMYHWQDCCESVAVDEVVGDISDIIGHEIIKAEEKTNSDDTFGRVQYPDSFTWTFYTIATNKGYLDIKWLGQSNGYYSERVDFEELKSE